MANAKKARSRVIQRATEHYKSKPLKRIEIPEWGDEDGPLVAFSSPFTLKDQARVRYIAEKHGDVDVLPELLIMKLVDEDGEKIFTIEDKNDLRNSVDGNIAARIANEIMAVSEEQLEKN